MYLSALEAVKCIAWGGAHHVELVWRHVNAFVPLCFVVPLSNSAETELTTTCEKQALIDDEISNRY